MSNIDSFLRTIFARIPWKILCLQEFVFTRNLGAETFDIYDGHMVLCNPQVMGARPCGLIFHHEIRHLIVKTTRQVYDRGLAIGIHWMGINMLVGCSHLSANRKRIGFDTSLQI